MRIKIKNIVDTGLERAVCVSIFAIAFTIVGYFTPLLYTKFVDKKEYISIHQPVSTELAQYKRGDNLGLIIKKNVLMDISAKQVAKIVHVNGTNIATQLSNLYSPKEILLSNTNGTYAVVKTNTVHVPCNAIPGSNFMQVMFTYDVNGIEKTYSYISEVFEVLDEDSEMCQK